MNLRTPLRVAVPLLCGAVMSTALAQEAAHSPAVHFIWMGGNDCPPCVAWRRFDLPKLKELPEFKSITLPHVSKRSTAQALKTGP